MKRATEICALTVPPTGAPEVAEELLHRAKSGLERNAKWAGGEFEFNGIHVKLTVDADRIVGLASLGSVCIGVSRAP
jgi:hypothetical protein